MERRLFLKNALFMATVPVYCTGLGCGTIMYADRVGQPRSGPIDWKVAAMDGAGLIFFFVPGVIAFAVDYYNGTLFLPTSTAPEIITASIDQETSVTPQFHEVSMPKNAIYRRDIELAISQQQGHPVTIDDHAARIAPLTSLADFSREYKRFAENPESGISPRDVFAS